MDFGGFVLAFMLGMAFVVFIRVADSNARARGRPTSRKTKRRSNQ